MPSEYLNNKRFEEIIEKFRTSKQNRLRQQLLLDEVKETYDRKKKRGVPDKLGKKLIINFSNSLKEAELLFIISQKELANAFYILSENIVRYAKFNLIDADDALQEGVLICFEKIDRFDSTKGKAFNYMTTCILNHFRQLYRSARNYNELKRKYQEFVNLFVEENQTKRIKRHNKT